MKKHQIQKRLQEIFDYAQSNTEALVEIYKLAIPNLDNIQTLKGHPVAGKELWTHIWRLFIQLDHRLSTNEYSGAIWVNQGWGMSSKLEPWAISLDKCKITYN